ncbi:MAG TPA: NrfD/PsrC family molybdoenzyme membrane anchor subunit [Thermodesulfobacteriota bacterium]|nr:NrfD/PsrC family molybdoenzyme membrane anchor subunit [Thermodesulfobacteriota bacterium]
MRAGDLHPIRRTRYLKPQEEWKEIIAIYLYLAGMGAGSFIIGTLIGWLNVKLGSPFFSSIDLFGHTLNLSSVPILWGPVMVAIGAPFLILDLGIKWRFIYACLNPGTSWVARGFIILSIFIVLGLALLAKSILPFEWLHPGSVLWRIPEIIAFIFAFGTALYTGILLKATKSVPLWNTSLLPLLFLVSGLSTGSMAIILSTLGTGLFSHNALPLKVLMGGEQVLVVIEAIILYLFLSRRYWAAEQGKDSVHLLVFGEMKMIFWGGVVFLGFIFPVILENIASFFPGNVVLIFVTGTLLLGGGFFLRLGILRAGIKDQIPMHRLMEIQHDTKTLAEERM